MFNHIKRIIFFTFVFFACLFFIDNVLFCGEDKVTVRAVSRSSKNRMGIGEGLLYTTTVFSDRDIEVNIPAEETFGVFEIRDSGISKKQHMAGYRVRLWHELTVYETGPQVIPGMNIDYRFPGYEWNRVKSNDVDVYVQSVFEKSKIEADIRPIEPPAGLKFPYRWHIAIGIPALCVLIYLIIIYEKFRKRLLEKRRKSPASNILAYKKLSDNLVPLEHKTELQAHEFIVLAELVKRYLCLNFNIDSNRLTTEEFLQAIKEHDIFYSKYSQDLSFILRTCDMAKFANYIPETEESKRIISLVVAIKNNVLPNETQE